MAGKISKIGGEKFTYRSCIWTVFVVGLLFSIIAGLLLYGVEYLFFSGPVPSYVALPVQLIIFIAILAFFLRRKYAPTNSQIALTALLFLVFAFVLNFLVLVIVVPLVFGMTFVGIFGIVSQNADIDIDVSDFSSFEESVLEDQVAGLQFDTMEEYVDLVVTMATKFQYEAVEPVGYERVNSADGEAINVTIPTSVAATVFVLAELGNLQTFYLEVFGPLYCQSEMDCFESSVTQWYGPFQGDLNQLLSLDETASEEGILRGESTVSSLTTYINDEYNYSFVYDSQNYEVTESLARSGATGEENDMTTIEEIGEDLCRDFVSIFISRATLQEELTDLEFRIDGDGSYITVGDLSAVKKSGTIVEHRPPCFDSMTEVVFESNSNTFLISAPPSADNLLDEILTTLEFN